MKLQCKPQGIPAQHTLCPMMLLLPGTIFHHPLPEEHFYGKGIISQPYHTISGPPASPVQLSTPEPAAQMC